MSKESFSASGSLRNSGAIPKTPHPALFTELQSVVFDRLNCKRFLIYPPNASAFATQQQERMRTINALVSFPLLWHITGAKQVSVRGSLASGRRNGVDHKTSEWTRGRETQWGQREDMLPRHGLITYLLLPGLLSHQLTPGIKPLKESGAFLLQSLLQYWIHWLGDKPLTRESFRGHCTSKQE